MADVLASPEQLAALPPVALAELNAALANARAALDDLAVSIDNGVPVDTVQLNAAAAERAARNVTATLHRILEGPRP